MRRRLLCSKSTTASWRRQKPRMQAIALIAARQVQRCSQPYAIVVSRQRRVSDHDVEPSTLQALLLHDVALAYWG